MIASANRRRRRATLRAGVAGAVLGALLLAGCGGSEEPEPGEALERETITYSRTGGVAGVGEFLAIEPDGQARLQVGIVEPRSTTFEVPAATLDELYRGLEEAGIVELEAPEEESGCADCFTYEVGMGSEHVDGDDIDFPAELEPVLGELQEIVADNAARSGSGPEEP